MNTSRLTTFMRTYWHYIVIGILGVLLIGAVMWGVNNEQQAERLRRQTTLTQQPDTATQLAEHGITPLEKDQASNNDQTARELAYLIEEEKLAHDV